MSVQIPDTQNQKDLRNVYINKVGIKSFKYPMKVEIDGKIQPTVATLDLVTELSADKRGTNMSRFVEVIEEFDDAINFENLKKLSYRMMQHCESQSSTIIIKCSVFLDKEAPVSKKVSKLDYDLCIEGRLINDEFTYVLSVVVPVKSLCPCSKAISKYGAHNQRSHVTVTVTDTKIIDVLSIIKLVEKQASCEIYGLLKREDEKFVTEYAYENPKFVEDSVRDISISLKQMGYQSHTIHVENFESIHNHSAYAVITN